MNLDLKVKIIAAAQNRDLKLNRYCGSQACHFLGGYMFCFLIYSLLYPTLKL